MSLFLAESLRVSGNCALYCPPTSINLLRIPPGNLPNSVYTSTNVSTIINYAFKVVCNDVFKDRQMNFIMKYY